MQIKDIMTSHVEVISPDATLTEAAEKMSQLDIGPVPVCDNERLVGMLTDRDITVRATAKGYDPNTILVSEVMTPEVIYCFEDHDVEIAAEMMKRHQIRRVPVLNRRKRLVGMISLGDLAASIGNEQLAGDILQSVSEPTEPSR